MSYYVRIILVTCCISSLTFAFANVQSQTLQATSSSLLLLLSWWICSHYKTYEIGGWLLFYYINVYNIVIITLINIVTDITGFIPSSWEDSNLYIMWILSVCLVTSAIIAEVLFATQALIMRSYKYLNRLRFVLAINIAIMLLSIYIDSRYLDKYNVRMYSVRLIWSIIWLPYFYKSDRVHRAFLAKSKF
ncbi:MAG: DUF2569 family protein [Dissulfurispiraceae bacterium]